jgi:hypothetical protein
VIIFGEPIKYFERSIGIRRIRNLSVHFSNLRVTRGLFRVLPVRISNFRLPDKARCLKHDPKNGNRYFLATNGNAFAARSRSNNSPTRDGDYPKPSCFRPEPFALTYAARSAGTRDRARNAVPRHKPKPAPRAVRSGYDSRNTSTCFGRTGRAVAGSKIRPHFVPLFELEHDPKKRKPVFPRDKRERVCGEITLKQQPNARWRLPKAIVL